MVRRGARDKVGLARGTDKVDVKKAREATWNEAEPEHCNHIKGSDIEDLGRLVGPHRAAQAAVP